MAKLKLSRRNKFFSVFILLACAGLLLSACVTSGSSAPVRQGTAETPPGPLSEIYTGEAAPETQVPPTQRLETLSPEASRRPVKVGLLLPLSGQHAVLGQAMMNAAQMALFDIGHDAFELLPRDTQGTPNGAYEAARSVAQEGAELILGPVFSESVKAAKPVAQSARINMIAFTTDWSQGGGNTFIMGFLPFDQIQRITAFARRQNMTDIGVIAPNTDYGRIVSSSYQTAARSYALNTVNMITFSPYMRNLSQVVRDFSQYDRRRPQDGMTNAYPSNTPPPFDAVLMPVGGDMAISIANLMSQYGLPPREVKRLGTGLFDDPALAAEPSLEGAQFAAPSPRQRQDFERRYRQTFGKTPPRLSTLAYDASALAAVLAQRGLLDNGKPAFDARSIANPNGFAGIDGIFRFRSNGMVERGLAVLEFRRGQIVIVDDAPKSFAPQVSNDPRI